MGLQVTMAAAWGRTRSMLEAFENVWGLAEELNLSYGNYDPQVVREDAPSIKRKASFAELLATIAACVSKGEEGQ